MKFSKKTKPRSKSSMKLHKKLERRAEKSIKKKKQKTWFDLELLTEAYRLELEGIPSEEMYKHFKIVYSEEEHNSKFMLDSELKKLGLFVLRVKQTNGDIVYIYLKKGYKLVI